MQKTLTEVVEYLECLKVLDVFEKRTAAQKKGNDKSKIRLSPNVKSIGPIEKEKKFSKRVRDPHTQITLVTVRMALRQRKVSKSI